MLFMRFIYRLKVSKTAGWSRALVLPYGLKKLRLRVRFCLGLYTAILSTVVQNFQNHHQLNQLEQALFNYTFLNEDVQKYSFKLPTFTKGKGTLLFVDR